MTQEALSFVRKIGCFCEGGIVKSYSMSSKDYILVQTGNSYKIITQVDLKIKMISPLFEKDIWFIEVYNEFVQVYFEKSVIKMHFSHCIDQL